MVATVKLKHVDRTDSGGWRYRRRIPTPLVEVIGRVWFRHYFEAKTEAALVGEYPKAEAAFAKLVKEAKASLSTVETQSPREAWFAATLKVPLLVHEGEAVAPRGNTLHVRRADYRADYRAAYEKFGKALMTSLRWHRDYPEFCALTW